MPVGSRRHSCHSNRSFPDTNGHLVPVGKGVLLAAPRHGHAEDDCEIDLAPSSKVQATDQVVLPP